MKRNYLLVGLAILAAGAVGYAKGAAKAGVMKAPADMEWVDLMKGAPLKQAKLWGDRDKGGEYGMLLKIPAGFEAGMHSHTADYQAVLIQGTWVHTFADGTAKEMGPGGYVFQPGKQDHNDACKGTQECILLVHQHAKGDFVPAKAAAPAKEPAKTPEKAPEKAPK